MSTAPTGPTGSTSPTGGVSSDAAARPGSDRASSILAAAARVFSAKGFAATSMREIAQESGASLGSIYHHFESKEAILRALICGNFRRVREGLEARLEAGAPVDGRTALETFVDNHVGFFALHLDEMRVMSHELDTLGGEAGDEVAELRRSYSRVARDILARLRPDLDSDELQVATLCLFGMLNWTYRWFHALPQSVGAEGLARTMTRLFLDGFLAEG